MFDDDDDQDHGGGMFGMFDDEEEQQQPSTPPLPSEPVPDRDPDCPVVEGDVRQRRVMVKDEDGGASSPATIRSYEPASNTYTIVWLETGVMQYRTAPQSVDWAAAVEYEAPHVAVREDKDELWLAARRGDLEAVRRFILEEGVDRNETGPEQSRTPFYHAVFCGQAPVVDFLIAQGCWDEDNTAFITANAHIREIMLRTNTRRRSSAAAAAAPVAADTRRRSTAAVVGAAQRRESSAPPPPVPPLPSSDAPAAAPTAPAPVDDKKAAAEERKSRRKSKRASVTFAADVEEVVVTKAGDVKPVASSSALVAKTRTRTSSSRFVPPSLARLAKRVLGVFARRTATAAASSS